MTTTDSADVETEHQNHVPSTSTQSQTTSDQVDPESQQTTQKGAKSIAYLLHTATLYEVTASTDTSSKGIMKTFTHHAITVC
jgi:hypothetical protein